MRDDVAAGVRELCRLLDRKKALLNRLLLSESDKIHYLKSENIERVSSILIEDDTIMDEIDCIDFDIAHNEESLGGTIGVPRRDLFGMLDGNEPPARELFALRDEVRTLLERLLHERKRLGDAMQSATREVRQHIEGIARIRGLKLPLDE